jgi:hypothetical protein
MSTVSGPQAPDISDKHIIKQFWLDIYGKEVQTPVTYSYVWMADQMGHVCLGIIINFALTLGLRFALPWIGIASDRDEIGGLLLGSLVVSVWEFSAFRSSAKVATGVFPLDRKLLRDNAIIAALYMVIGVVIGYVFHKSELIGIAGFIAMVLVGVIFAPSWLRQKIIWQKAALPYLFRLADAQRTVGSDIARELQALIDQDAPPSELPRQVVIGGPIGSGRTDIAAGIGTEFAFKRARVRYLSLAELLEFAAQPPDPDFADDTGPKNINYWAWSQAQVLIIDDIGPLISAKTQAGQADLGQFQLTLAHGLGPIAAMLAKCHTVWVIGDLRAAGQSAMKGQALDDFARVIGEFCKAQQPVLVVELSAVPAPGRPAVAPAKEEVPAYGAQIRQV